MDIKITTIEQLKANLNESDKMLLAELLKKAESELNKRFLKSEIARLQQELEKITGKAQSCNYAPPPPSRELFLTLDSNEEKITEYVKNNVFSVLESNLLSREEIQALQDKNYCKQIFDINFPLLNKKIKDAKGYVRYYTNSIWVYGEEFFVCSQWFKGSFPYVKAWVEEHSYGLDIKKTPYSYQESRHKWTFEEDLICCQKYFQAFVLFGLKMSIADFIKSISEELSDIPENAIRIKMQNIKQLCIEEDIVDTLDITPLDQYSDQCKRAFKFIVNHNNNK